MLDEANDTKRLRLRGIPRSTKELRLRSLAAELTQVSKVHIPQIGAEDRAK